MRRTPLARLAEEFAEGVLMRSPTTATFLGDRRFDDHLPDIGPRGREEERAALMELRRRLALTDRTTLQAEDAITHHMLELAADFGLAALDRELYHLALDQMFGPQVSLAMLLNWHTLDTDRNARDLHSRFHAVPEYIDQYIVNLAEGVEQGRTSPRIAFERVVAQLKALLATPPEASPFGRAAQKAPSPVLRDALMAAVRDAV